MAEVFHLIYQIIDEACAKVKPRRRCLRKSTGPHSNLSKFGDVIPGLKKRALETLTPEHLSLTVAQLIDLLPTLAVISVVEGRGHEVRTPIAKSDGPNDTRETKDQRRQQHPDVVASSTTPAKKDEKIKRVSKTEKPPKTDDAKSPPTARGKGKEQAVLEISDPQERSTDGQKVLGPKSSHVTGTSAQTAAMKHSSLKPEEIEASAAALPSSIQKAYLDDWQTEQVHDRYIAEAPSAEAKTAHDGGVSPKTDVLQANTTPTDEVIEQLLTPPQAKPAQQKDATKPQAKVLRHAARPTLADIAKDWEIKTADTGVRGRDQDGSIPRKKMFAETPAEASPMPSIAGEVAEQVPGGTDEPLKPTGSKTKHRGRKAQQVLVLKGKGAGLEEPSHMSQIVSDAEQSAKSEDYDEQGTYKKSIMKKKP